MEDVGATALAALILGFVPAAIITFALVVVVAVIVLFVGFLWLLDQPLWGWFYVMSFVFNAVILVPLWVVSWLAARYEPDLWSEADAYVYAFSIAFVVPTALFYVSWKREVSTEKEQ